MKNLIAAGLMILTMGMAAVAEPVEKNTVSQPAPAPVVTTTVQEAQAQPEIKKEQQPVEKTQAQPAPVKQRKPVELNFRNF